MTGPQLVLSDANLIPEFGSGAVARGRSYARQGMVLDHDWDPARKVLTGHCAGSGGRRYRQRISFNGTPSIGTIDDASCSCPLGGYCKHAVAVLISVSHASPPRAPAPAAPAMLTLPMDTWREAFAPILGTPLPQRNDAPVDLKPMALAFSVTRPTKYAPQQYLTLRPMIRGAKQNWIKTGASWTDIGVGVRFDVEPEHVGAVKAVQRALPGHGLGRDTVNLSQAPARIWQLLDDAVSAGVTLITGAPLRTTLSVHLGRADFRYAVSEHPDGASVRTELVIDGNAVTPESIGFIGTPRPHGLWYIDDDRLVVAGFAQDVVAVELESFILDREIIVPAADLAEFSMEVLPRLEQRRTVSVPARLIEPPTIAGPFAVLTIADATGGGGRYSWSVGYSINDSQVVFDVRQPIGPTPYRDAETEAALWDRVRPDMQVVASFCTSWWAPGSSGTGVDAIVDASVSALQQPNVLSANELAVFCGEVLPQLQSDDIRIDYRCGRVFQAIDDAPSITFGTDGDLANDWFGLDVTVTVGDVEVPIAELIAQLSSGATHMVVDDDRYFSLDVPELRRLAKLLEEAKSLGEIESGKVRSQSLNASFWEELLELGVVDEQLATWRAKMAVLSKAAPPQPVTPSKGLHAQLREYQQTGLDWLSFLWTNGLGGVLADDMGLGKTVQTLALVAGVVDEKPTARFLVIAPTSVVPNWVAECEKFVPDLSVSSITATESRSGIPVAESVDGMHVVVTSYALLRIMFDDVDAYEWDGVVFDEAQFIKNHTGKTHQCARRLRSSFKVMITGTPMENNLTELWALLSVSAPGLFPSPTSFNEYFRKPIESGAEPERLDTLRRRIKPVMLRRTKGQVAVDLPPKQEQAMVLDLSSKHRKIYDTRLARERQKVLGLLGDWEKNRFQIFRSLTMLRQLSLHAALVDSTHSEIGSTKVDYLGEQLATLIDEGHSALVFSQFTGFLEILRTHLDAAGIVYSYLDGSMIARQRSTAVKKFTSGATQVFLISLKAGGFGLNLTEADYCFVCDPWWNPAAEAQAIDRAHRIGQQRPVSVYRLVSADTIEERVVRLQERKRALFDAVVDDGELFGSAISAADIREMLG